MSKVTVVGAGNVGATAANVIAVKNIASEVVLIDIKEGVAEGKAMDIMQSAQTIGFDTVVKGVTNDYSQTAGSDVVVITSGIPRKPGMTREELIGVNAGIVKSVASQILAVSPNAIIIVVSNPMDTMAYLTLKATGLPRNRVIGMGGALDSSRFRYYLSQKLNCFAHDVDAFVIGGHGDTTMIPMRRFATYRGMSIEEMIGTEAMDEVVKQTMVGGATLTGLLGTSAWMAPGASIASMVDAILNDKKQMIPASVKLEGEYGFDDIMMGAPCIIGRNGIEQVCELKLTDDEKALYKASHDAVAKTTNVLHELNLI